MPKSAEEIACDAYEKLRVASQYDEAGRIAIIVEEFAKAVEEFTATDRERELRASRDSFRDGYKRLQSELELEERVADAEADAIRLNREKMDRVVELISERQRREEAETALRGMLIEWDKLSRYGSPMAKQANERVAAANNHFRKYEPIPADREEERGG